MSSVHQAQTGSIPVTSIVADKNIRELDSGHVQALASSMRNVGLINPITVRKKGKGYDLIAGHHRLAAAIEAGLTDIPVRFTDADASNSNIISISENLVRKDLSYSETVAAVRELRTHTSWDEREIAQKLSIHVRSAAEMAHISELPQEFIDRSDNNPPLRKQFRAFARLADERRAQAVTQIIEFASANDNRYPTAPLMEKLVTKLSLGLQTAKFDVTECKTCPMNTACSTSLFEDTEDADGICTKPECFEKKTSDALEATAVAVHDSLGIPASQRIVFDSSVRMDAPGKADGSRAGESVIIDFLPWRPEELKEAVNGCAECEHRCVALQTLMTRHTAAAICTKPTCYNGLLAEQESADNKSQTAVPGKETSPRSKGTVTTPATQKDAKKPAGVTIALDRKSTAVTEQRRSILENAVAETATTTKDGVIIIKALLALFHNGAVKTSKSSKAAKLAELDQATVQMEVRKTICANVKDVRGHTLFNLFTILGGNPIMLSHLGLHDEEFLNKLTCGELLALLKEGGFDDEPKWKKLRSAKKSVIVNAVLEYTFASDFIPECLKPTAGEEHGRQIN